MVIKCIGTMSTMLRFRQVLHLSGLQTDQQIEKQSLVEISRKYIVSTTVRIRPSTKVIIIMAVTTVCFKIEE